jgi:hypothetical protein
MPPERGRVRYGLLLLATVLSVAVQGTVEPSAAQQVVVTALAGTILVLAFHAAELPTLIIRFAVVLAGAALAVALLRATAGGIGDGAARTMNAALISLGPPAVAIGIIRNLRAAGEVRVEAVFGVLCLYVLIGMAFGFVYGAIDQFGGDPFFANGAPATVAHCLYFSLTTLATVGYGDFVARTDLGHTLAVSEALIGQIYLVTVVSLIVGNLRRPVERAQRST